MSRKCTSKFFGTICKVICALLQISPDAFQNSESFEILPCFFVACTCTIPRKNNKYSKEYLVVSSELSIGGELFARAGAEGLKMQSINKVELVFNSTFDFRWCLCFTHMWTVYAVTKYNLSQGQCIPLEMEDKLVPGLYSLAFWSFEEEQRPW